MSTFPQAVRRIGPLLLMVGLLVGFTARPAAAVTLPSGFHDEVAFPDLQEPTTLRFAADGRVFVALKTGKILVFDDLEDQTPTVFADLRTYVYDTNDRGILGMALDPQFPTKPYVYVLYTYDHLLGDSAPPPKWGEPDHSGDVCPLPPGADSDACPVSGRIVRLTAAPDGDHAAVDGGGEVEQDVLVEGWCTQYSSHSIGDLQFGPEGILYASGGDGSNAASADYGQGGWPNVNQCADPPSNTVGGIETPPTAEGGALRAQDVRTLADPTGLGGTVIRIDPETGEGLPSNPFYDVTTDENARRIIAYGFRNPFRFAIDPVSDEIYVGNVGWYTYEEIDRFSTDPHPALNSGWPCYEGPTVTPVYSDLGLNVCEDLYFKEPGLTAPPFFYYKHGSPVVPEDSCPPGDENGSAVAGLDFYEGNAFPPRYKGALFFSDPVRGCAYVMFPGTGADTRPDPSTATPFLISESGSYPAVDIEEGPEGSLYYAQLFGPGFTLGAIHRISYSSDNQPPTARLTADNTWSAGDLETTFDATGSSDADGEALQYEWDPENDGSYEAPTSAGTFFAHYTDSQNHTVAVRVRDGKDATAVARMTVYPHDSPPVPQIITPAESPTEPGVAALRWHVGQRLSFSGKATDPEDGDLPAVNLDWSSRLLHCPAGCHAHPLQAFPAVDSGSFTAPDHEYPSHIELTLTATDPRGLQGRTTLTLDPASVQLQLRSEPAGIQLGAAEVSEPTPFDLTAIEDTNMSISAPATTVVGGREYAWSSWSDGKARVHSIVAASDATYTAVYEKVGPDPEPEPEPDPEPEPEPEAGSGSTGTPTSPSTGGGSEGRPSSPGPGPVVGPPAPPSTHLRRHPARRTRSVTARFVLAAGGGGTRFRCKLDAGRYRACRSPLVYRHLKPGAHVLRVVAVGASGAADPTPVVFRWRVTAKRA